MDRGAILKAFEANLWDHASFLARSRKEAEVQESADLLVVDSGLPSKSLNTIGRCSLHPRFGIDRIEAAVKRFRSKSAPFSWLLTANSGHGAMEPTLNDLGLSCPEEEWIMAMALDQTNIPGNVPPGLDIKRVSTTTELEHFANVLAASKTPVDEHIKTFFADTKEAATKPASPLMLYVGYTNKEPVAVLEAFSAHGIITFYAMAAATNTKGLAGALILNALRESKKANLRLAALQTKEAGRAVYERIGFKPVGRIAAYG